MQIKIFDYILYCMFFTAILLSVFVLIYHVPYSHFYGEISEYEYSQVAEFSINNEGMYDIINDAMSDNVISNYEYQRILDKYRIQSKKAVKNRIHTYQSHKKAENELSN